MKGKRLRGRRRQVLDLFVLGVLGVSVTFSFGMRNHTFIPVYIVILLLTTIYGVWRGGGSKIGFLPKVLLLAYLLTFAGLVEYLLLGEVNVGFERQMTSDLFNDKQSLAFITCLAALGAIGLVFGVRLSDYLLGRRAGSDFSSKTTNECKALPLYIFSLWAITLPLLYTLILPRLTILDGAYADIRNSTIGGVGIPFAAYTYIIYIGLACLWIDSEFDRDKSKKIRRKKQIIVLMATFWVVVVLELPRGERTSAGLIVALTGLYLTGLSGFNDGSVSVTLRHKARVQVIRVTVITGILVLVFIVAGAIRNSFYSEGVSGERIATSVRNIYKSDAWVGGFYASYGLAREYIGAGYWSPFWGQTYLDYFLSLPPGPVANALDYVRPIDEDGGPGWWYIGYTKGGISPVIVPFKNFGVWGVFAILTLFGMMFCWFERIGQKGRFWPRLVYCSVMVSALHWVWYGDMYLIRAVMIGGLIGMIRQWLARRPKVRPI